MFNNAGIAALTYALRPPPALIADFDYHHGNSTSDRRRRRQRVDARLVSVSGDGGPIHNAC